MPASASKSTTNPDHAAKARQAAATQDHYLGGAFSLLIAGLATSALRWFDARSKKAKPQSATSKSPADKAGLLLVAR